MRERRGRRGTRPPGRPPPRSPRQHGPVGAGHERIGRRVQDVRAGARPVPRRRGRAQRSGRRTHPAGEHRRRDAAEHRHAQHAPHVARRVVDGRTHPGHGRRQLPHRRRGRGRHGQPDARADDDHGQDVVPVPGRAGGGREDQQAAGYRGQPQRHRHPHPGPPGQRRPDRAEHGQRRRGGQRPHPGRQRAVAQHELVDLRAQERHSGQGEEQHGDGQAGPGEARVAEQSQRQHRVRGARLPGHEQTQQDDRRRAEPQRPGRQPAVGGRLDDRVGEPGERRDRQRRPGQVEPPGARGPRRRDQPVPRDERDRHDRQVDQEDRVPVEVVEQPAARHRADRHAQAADRGPQADHLGPFGVVGEHLHLYVCKATLVLLS